MGQASGKEKGDAGNSSVDGGYLIPQGVYSTAQDYDHSIVKAMIQSRKLAPFYTGLDDEEAYAQAPYNTECPICFLVSDITKRRKCVVSELFHSYSPSFVKIISLLSLVALSIAP